MNPNNKWNEIQKLLKQCHSDLKIIKKDITALEKTLQLTKKKVH